MVSCPKCNRQTVHKTKIRIGDLASLSAGKKIIYNTIKSGYYMNNYHCFNCNYMWEGAEYSKDEYDTD